MSKVVCPECGGEVWREAIESHWLPDEGSFVEYLCICRECGKRFYQFG